MRSSAQTSAVGSQSSSRRRTLLRSEAPVPIHSPPTCPCMDPSVTLFRLTGVDAGAGAPDRQAASG
jgi:hypothetical protein